MNLSEHLTEARDGSELRRVLRDAFAPWSTPGTLADVALDALASLATDGVLVIDTDTGRLLRLRQVEVESVDVGAGYLDVVHENAPLFALDRTGEDQ